MNTGDNNVNGDNNNNLINSGIRVDSYPMGIALRRIQAR
jgi:hypothetical protein